MMLFSDLFHLQAKAKQSALEALWLTLVDSSYWAQLQNWKLKQDTIHNTENHFIILLQ